jgi:hypothetical protein
MKSCLGAARLPRIAGSALATLRVVGAAALALAAACGDDGGDGSFMTMGTPGMPSPARTGANLIFAEVDVDGNDGPFMLVDTGSPFTLIDAADFPSIDFPKRAEIKVDLTFGSFTVNDVPALQTSFLTDGNFTIPAIVGGNMMREFSTQFDYRGMQLRIGEGGDPAGVESGGTLAFALEGGGVGTIDAARTMVVNFPSTRVAVTVDIEGTSHPMVLDSGASEVTLRQELFDSLVADGRAQVSGFALSTASGPMAGRVTRARAITVGDQTVVGPAILSLGSDELLDSLAHEVGHPVDGLLGGSFLREFLVTIDYPRRSLRLQRYVPPSPVPDEFRRVGIELAPSASGFAIAKVYQGSDAAAKQLAVRDVIVSIDGQNLAGMNGIEADLLLDGEVGTTKQLGLGATADAGIANTIIPVRVDDLLPVP